MSTRILLVGYNFEPEPTGIGKYSGEMINWLAQKGCDCTVVTTYPYYPYWSVQEPYRKYRFWYKVEHKQFDAGGSVKVIRCPIYVPKNPTGLKRIILDFSFLVSSFFPMLFILFKKRMDIVMAVAPSFLIGVPAMIYRVFRKTKFVYHIQDMQIEAAQDLGMIKSSALIRGLFSIERAIFKRADVVSSISEGMIQRIGSKAKKEVYFLPNWTDVEAFYPLANRNQLKSDFGFESDDQIVLYSGGIGQKQGLESILEAAKYFRERANIKFVICGSGPYKHKLEEMAKQFNLSQVIFFPLQPIEKFNAFLNLADVHLVIQKADASDLMLPSKLTTILSVGGLALITANQGSGLYNLAEKYNVGKVVPAENEQALISGIENCLAASEVNDEIMKSSRQYAMDYLNIHNIMERFRNDMF